MQLRIISQQVPKHTGSWAFIQWLLRLLGG